MIQQNDHCLSDMNTYLATSWLTSYQLPNLPLGRSSFLTSANTNLLFHRRYILATERIDLPCLKLLIPPPALPPWIMPELEVHLSLLPFGRGSASPETARSAFMKIASQFSSSTFLYTDGSKTENGVGCALANKSGVIRRYTLPSAFSILSAELFAIKLAVEHIRNMNKPLIPSAQIHSRHYSPCKIPTVRTNIQLPDN